MRKIVFDIETSNTFQEAESTDPADLDLSLVGVYDSETDQYTSYLQDELAHLWPVIEKASMLIGYNSDHFDIPLLNKYYPGDLTQIKSLDLLKEVRASLGRRIKLDTIAGATLGTAKSGDGLEAIRWWRDGDVEKVRKYCLQDVKITKDIYDYAREHGKLMYTDMGATRDIPLDTSSWEELGDTHGMTHTLPF